MNVDFINPFLDAAKNVLETMAQVSVKPKTPYIKKQPLSYGEVTGIIGVASKTIKGVMVLSFSDSCILRIVANMLIEPLKEKIDDEIIDAVGELTNMICGGAKASLSKLDHHFELTIPTMVVGTGVEIKHYTKAPIIVIPFETEFGPFVVEANLEKK
jgi:chemotaxis protein CheX